MHTLVNQAKLGGASLLGYRLWVGGGSILEPYDVLVQFDVTGVIVVLVVIVIVTVHRDTVCISWFELRSNCILHRKD